MDQILPYQNFPSIQSMIFSKRTIRTTSVPKIRKIHSGVWKLKAKNLQNSQFWAKFLTISEFSGIYTMIFSRKTTKVVSIPKIMKIYSGVWKIQAKNTQKCLFWPKWPNFDHFWPFWGSKNFSIEKIFWGSSKSYEDTTSCKKLEKNIERSRLQDRNTRTHARTYVRTHARE